MRETRFIVAPNPAQNMPLTCQPKGALGTKKAPPDCQRAGPGPWLRLVLPPQPRAGWQRDLIACSAPLLARLTKRWTVCKSGSMRTGFSGALSRQRAMAMAAALLLPFLLLRTDAADPPAHEARFEKEIQAFEASDKTNPP